MRRWPSELIHTQMEPEMEPETQVVSVRSTVLSYAYSHAHAHLLLVRGFRGPLGSFTFLGALSLLLQLSKHPKILPFPQALNPTPECLSFAFFRILVISGGQTVTTWSLRHMSHVHGTTSKQEEVATSHNNSLSMFTAICGLLGPVYPYTLNTLSLTRHGVIIINLFYKWGNQGS